MKRFALIIAAALTLMSVPASANEIFDLTGVTLKDQYGVLVGTATGSITLNNGLTSLVAMDIQTTAAAGGGGFTFAAVDYNLSNPSAVLSDVLGANGYIRLDIGGDELQFAINTFSASGITLYLTGQSSDHQAAAGNRLIIAGSFVPEVVPEPATWTILLGALAMFGMGLLWRSKRFARLTLAGSHSA